MCAIAGLIGYSVSEENLDKMLSTMSLRGPDARGIVTHGQCTLLHSRLTIIDPEGGRQPMELSWAGEQYVIVYNGELYNTTELRRELEVLGHRFNGYSDTEVVLHSYAQWKEKCLDRLNGIFSFGIWETKRQRLFLARDRIGVKPLFYMHKKEQLIFASEIKTILTVPGIRAELDEDGAAQLLLLGPGRLPGSGVFKNMQELEPGCFAYYESGKLCLYRYWRLMDREHTDSLEETVEKVRYLLTDAIRRQMISDMPIGTFLSGGLDSSIITAVCAKEMADALPTFSVDYWNNELYFQSNKFQPDSDDDYIRLMQRHLQTDHHWTVLSPQDIESHLEDATIARDLPGMADVDFSLLAFCKDIRKSVKVALSGECADEIFGGYPWYRDPEVRAVQGFPWAQNTIYRCGLCTPDLKLDGESFVMDAYLQTCRESDILPENSPRERRMKEMMNLNFRWFMQTLLDRKDRMSMAASLEVRVPFCDYRIAEYLYAVPWEMKDLNGREKGLLRRAAEDLLPEEVLYRKKSPYPKILDPEYERRMDYRLMELMKQKDAPLWQLVQPKQLGKLLESNFTWPWYGQLMRRPQTIAYFLQMDFWLRYYGVQFVF